GLACRGAGAKRVPCGAPVAVVRSTKDLRGRVRFSTSVYCGRHVAEIVRRQLGEADWRGTPSSVGTIRKAEETVLAAHWDEYQETLNQLREGFDAAEAVA
ncbi:hypothetical protein, partial [uncultured Microbacterium sp.]|uniref:hypothetical protein n=1 Tax=uncultured Microbacterium sp. TaxID=191216 RepID=UPI0025F01506